MGFSIKDWFLKYNQWFALLLCLVVLVSGGHYLSVFLFESEQRVYSIDYQDRPEVLYLVVEAPNGFNSGNTARFTDYYMRGDENLAAKEIQLGVLQGDAVLTDVNRTGENMFYLFSERATSGHDSFELANDQKFLSNLFYVEENSTRTQIAQSDFRAIDVGPDSRPQFVLGLIALFGLCFSIISGVKSFSAMIEQGN